MLEVEVEEGGGTEWRLGQVAEVTRGGRFTVCLVGDGEDASTFRETYSMADHGKEWRWPERSKRQRQAPQQPTRQAEGSSSDEASGEGGEADGNELAGEEEEAEGEESGRRTGRAGRAGGGAPDSGAPESVQEKRQGKLQRELMQLQNFDRSAASRSRRSASDEVVAVATAATTSNGRRGSGTELTIAGAGGARGGAEEEDSASEEEEEEEEDDDEGEDGEGGREGEEEGREGGESRPGGRLRSRSTRVNYREPSMHDTRRGMVKVAPWQCPSSAPVPPRSAPGGSGRFGTPRKRPPHRAPSHCLGCSS